MKEGFKMKKKLSLAAILLICLMTLSLISSAASIPKEERVLTQDDVLSIAYQVHDNYSDDSFGGMYIDENGELVVCLLSNSSNKDIQSFASRLESNVSQTQFINYTNVKYSLEELNKEIEYLSLYMQELNIESIALNERLNKIFIVVPKNYSNYDKLTSILTNSDMVEIMESEGGECVNTLDLYPICGSEMKYSNISFSMGFPARWNGKYGYTVPGHAVSVGTQIYNGGIAPRSSVGTVRFQQFSGSADVAFVERQNTIFDTWHGRLSPYQTTSPPAMFSVIQGTTVQFKGQVSGNKTGTVMSTNFSVVASGVLLTKQVKSTYVAIKGDSGGTVYINSSSGSYIVGMQSSSYLPGDVWVSGTSYSVFTHIKEINNVGIYTSDF